MHPVFETRAEHREFRFLDDVAQKGKARDEMAAVKERHHAETSATGQFKSPYWPTSPTTRQAFRDAVREESMRAMVEARTAWFGRSDWADGINNNIKVQVTVSTPLMIMKREKRTRQRLMMTCFAISLFRRGSKGALATWAWSHEPTRASRGYLVHRS
ncbi:hypothetical protein K402DRAFT_439267 [Aulographum hederae CBS 113979]|uniref:Uncharacterized protein n=1 Tax=Aulographum hederae CBS 113979 TaxID=1176131 RepID=A0A6G1GLF6_9PEZI|nr:hypothetical protein K402DRAFT_439267 [Aulographum hederae CBS 113979]